MDGQGAGRARSSARTGKVEFTVKGRIHLELVAARGAPVFDDAARDVVGQIDLGDRAREDARVLLHEFVPAASGRDELHKGVRIFFARFGAEARDGGARAQIHLHQAAHPGFERVDERSLPVDRYVDVGAGPDENFGTSVAEKKMISPEMTR